MKWLVNWIKRRNNIEVARKKAMEAYLNSRVIEHHTTHVYKVPDTYKVKPKSVDEVLEEIREIIHEK